MILTIFKPFRVQFLKFCARAVERAGFSVVQINRTDDAVYLIGASGTYVRFDKVSKASKGKAANGKAMAAGSCRANPQYAGPSNCNQGTVGCTEQGHRA